MDLPTAASGLVALTTASQKISLAFQIIFAVIAFLAVSLRIVARYKRNLPLLWDDYLIIAALISALGLVACDLVSILYSGVGLHVADVVSSYGADRVTLLLKTLIPIQILWAISLSATKISILAFYVRVFDTKIIRLASKIISALILLWCTAVILSTFLLCRPFTVNWDSSITSSHCAHRKLSYIIPGVLNIVTDVLVIVLPLPVIWTLQMRRGNKIALSSVFAGGLIVCIACILRLVSLLSIDYADVTYTVNLPLIWSMIEPCATITIACLPIIKVLLQAPFRDISKTHSSSNKSPDTSRYSSSKSRSLASKRRSMFREDSLATNKDGLTTFVTDATPLPHSGDEESQLGEIEPEMSHGTGQDSLELNKKEEAVIVVSNEWTVR